MGHAFQPASPWISHVGHAFQPAFDVSGHPCPETTLKASSKLDHWHPRRHDSKLSNHHAAVGGKHLSLPTTNNPNPLRTNASPSSLPDINLNPSSQHPSVTIRLDNVAKCHYYMSNYDSLQRT